MLLRVGIGDALLRKVLVFVTTGLGCPCDGKTGRSGAIRWLRIDFAACLCVSESMGEGGRGVRIMILKV